MQVTPDVRQIVNNSIFIRRKKKLALPDAQNELPASYVLTLLKNIEPLGYTFSKELIAQASRLGKEEIKVHYLQLVDDLKMILGGHVLHKPMYVNFPEQVMEATDAELYMNALMHYLGDWMNMRIMPEHEKKPRPRLYDRIELKVIEPGTHTEFMKIFTSLLRAKTSISAIDKADISWFVSVYKEDIEQYLPARIPQKEVLAHLASQLVAHTEIADKIILKHVKTATDVLRIATGMSNGDVSLAQNTKFRKLTRPERKLLLTLLENCSSITEDMLRHPEKWKRLGERLHPFEYRNRFPKCYDGFDVTRNDKPFLTFNSKVESALMTNNVNNAIALLKARPGEFARRLDHLLRITGQWRPILVTFDEVCGRVTSPLLLQLQSHFSRRNAPMPLRTFFPKGNVAKAYAIKHRLPQISSEACKEVIAICGKHLLKKFSELPPLGKVYIDPRLRDFNVPFALRSSSRALRTIARGSRIALPEGNTLRFFLWWKDGRGRTDIDLSALALDENHKYKDQLTYYSLRTLGGCHSGDITSAPDGASEFIDIDMDSFRRSGIRYVLMVINSFTLQPFCDLPECFAGFMIRQSPNSGEIYEPRTVQDKIDINSDTQICIPLVIDLYERKVVWTDIALTQYPYFNNNVDSNLAPITLMNKAMTSLVKPTLYELFTLHAKARGTQVFEKPDADIIFAVDEGLTPFDTEKIISDYL